VSEVLEILVGVSYPGHHDCRVLAEGAHIGAIDIIQAAGESIDRPALPVIGVLYSECALRREMVARRFESLLGEQIVLQAHVARAGHQCQRLWQRRDNEMCFAFTRSRKARPSLTWTWTLRSLYGFARCSWAPNMLLVGGRSRRGVNVLRAVCERHCDVISVAGADDEDALVRVARGLVVRPPVGEFFRNSTVSGAML
jgi:hypothetical protein